MITDEQRNKVISLYVSNGYSISDIMRMTGIRSSQTIYRILRASGHDKQRKRKAVRKVTICLDEDANRILSEENPSNMSEWICEKIKKCSKFGY